MPSWASSRKPTGNRQRAIEKAKAINAKLKYLKSGCEKLQPLFDFADHRRDGYAIRSGKKPEQRKKR